MSDLTSKKCVPHEKIVALNQEEIKNYLSQLKEGWEFSVKNQRGNQRGPSSLVTPLVNKIYRGFKFKDFKEVMKFVNKVAEIAEEEGHHPNIEIYYNKVNIILWTHFVNGLSENDFIIAAKIDNLVLFDIIYKVDKVKI